MATFTRDRHARLVAVLFWAAGLGLVWTPQASAAGSATQPDVRPTTQSSDAGEKKMAFGRNRLTFEILATRSWAPPDSKFQLLKKVPEASYFYLQMDNLTIGGGLSVVLEDEGAGDACKVFATGKVFSRNCVKSQPPKGRYLEVLLMFENTAKEDVTQSITAAKGSCLDIPLTLPNGTTLHPVDFVAAGFSNSRLNHLEDLEKKGLTVITEFTGDLALFLRPGGRTWLIVQYDVPLDAKSADLDLCDSKPIRTSWK